MKGSTVSRRVSEFIGVALFAAALIWIIALASYNPSDPAWFFSAGVNRVPENFAGRVGAFLAEASFQFAGYAAYLIPAYMVMVGWHYFWCRPMDAAGSKTLGGGVLFALGDTLWRADKWLKKLRHADAELGVRASPGGSLSDVIYLVAELRNAGCEVEIISPADGYFTVPLVTYSEIKLALGARHSIEERFLAFAPDAVHIATEGTLGRMVVMVDRGSSHLTFGVLVMASAWNFCPRQRVVSFGTTRTLGLGIAMMVTAVSILHFQPRDICTVRRWVVSTLYLVVSLMDSLSHLM